MAGQDRHGGPAFPAPVFYDEKVIGTHDGMTLRDWFAGKAVGVLPGDVANPEQLADDAYLIADAMIRRRQVFPRPDDRQRPTRQPDDDDEAGS